MIGVFAPFHKICIVRRMPICVSFSLHYTGVICFLSLPHYFEALSLLYDYVQPDSRIGCLTIVQQGT